MIGMLMKALTEDNIPFTRFDGAPLPSDISSDSIIAYFSSKERFPSVFEECRTRGLTLIVATSGLEVGRDIPGSIDFPVVMAPNLSEIIMALFKTFSVFGKTLQQIGARGYVAEGHQATKTSAPSTAQKIAGYIGNSPDSVGSIRNDAIARAVIGIPEDKLGGFGAHFMAVSHRDANVRISFDTQGRKMYYFGLMSLVGKIQQLPDGLPPGLHEAHEVLFN